MPRPKNVIFFKSPAQLRAWFEANHESATELWVRQYRMSTGRPSLTWPELVDQCLCFGWIDGVRYSLDKESFAQRVTPRRKSSNWSAVNIKQFGELDKTGMAHPQGRSAFAARQKRAPLPIHMRTARAASIKSWKRSFASTTQRGSSSSRRLRTKRLQELIEHSTRGEKVT